MSDADENRRAIFERFKGQYISMREALSNHKAPYWEEIDPAIKAFLFTAWSTGVNDAATYANARGVHPSVVEEIGDIAACERHFEPDAQGGEETLMLKDDAHAACLRDFRLQPSGDQADDALRWIFAGTLFERYPFRCAGDRRSQINSWLLADYKSRKSTMVSG